MITRSDVIGGAGVHLLDLAAGVKFKGHDIVVAAGIKKDENSGVFFDRANDLGIKYLKIHNLVREISLLKDFLCFFELRKLMKDLRPDIVHVHSSKAGIIGRLVASSLSIPVIFTVHGWAFTEGVSFRKRQLYIWLERNVSCFSSKTITVSEYDRNLALAHKVGNASSLITVHNGVPDMPDMPDMPDIDVCKGSFSPEKLVKLIMVARFEKPKNQQALLNSLASLNNNRWHLELVGDGPELEGCRQLACQLNIINKVSFSGACSDVAKRLAKADIFILISNWEGLPLTILEAMRAGKPVIASDVGGVSESVEHNVSGYLIPRDSSIGLCEALIALIESGDLRAKMGIQARQKYEDGFTFRTMLDRTLNIYNEVLDSHP